MGIPTPPEWHRTRRAATHTAPLLAGRWREARGRQRPTRRRRDGAPPPPPPPPPPIPLGGRRLWEADEEEHALRKNRFASSSRSASGCLSEAGGQASPDDHFRAGEEGHGIAYWEAWAPGSGKGRLHSHWLWDGVSLLPPVHSPRERWEGKGRGKRWKGRKQSHWRGRASGDPVETATPPPCGHPEERVGPHGIRHEGRERLLPSWGKAWRRPSAS